MRFTDISILDPIMSIAFALYILLHSIKHLKHSLDLFLEKVPCGVDVKEVADADFPKLKKEIRERLKKFNVSHVTLETETVCEKCDNTYCDEE